MILTFMTGETKLDVMVKREQRIEDVYQKLLENGFFTVICHEESVRVYSLRKRSYVNPMLTFQQGGIERGDILKVLQG